MAGQTEKSMTQSAIDRIDGIGNKTLEHLRDNEKANENRDIVIEFKGIRMDKSLNDEELDKFIFQLIQIVHDIWQPLELKKKKGQLKDAETERKTAKKLVDKVKELLKDADDANKSNEDTIKSVIGNLKTKFEEHFREVEDGFYIFLGCLLMFEECDESKSKNKGMHVFSGVFTTWDLIRRLADFSLDGDELQFFFKDEIFERKQRSETVKTGFKINIKETIEEFIKGTGGEKSMIELCTFCEKEEDAKREFHKWFPDNSNIQRINFMNTYVHVKKLLPKVSPQEKRKNREDVNADNMQDLNNRKFLLRKEIEELRSVLDDHPSAGTDNREEDNEEHLHYSKSQLENLVIELEKEIVDWFNKMKGKDNEIPEVLEPVNRESHDEHQQTETNYSFNCLQINLKHKKKAWKKLIEERLDPKESSPHIVFIQEPWLERRPGSNYYYFRDIPNYYSAIHNLYLANDFENQCAINDYLGAVILVRDDVKFKRILPMKSELGKRYDYQELVAGIWLTDANISLYSIYCRPNRSLHLPLVPFRSRNANDMARTVFCMDANACHDSWTPKKVKKQKSTQTDQSTNPNICYFGRGEDLESFRKDCKLIVAKQSVQKSEDETKVDGWKSWENYTYIDVTFHGSSLSINDWEIENTITCRIILTSVFPFSAMNECPTFRMLYKT